MNKDELQNILNKLNSIDTNDIEVDILLSIIKENIKKKIAKRELESLLSKVLSKSEFMEVMY